MCKESNSNQKNKDCLVNVCLKQRYLGFNKGKLWWKTVCPGTLRQLLRQVFNVGKFTGFLVENYMLH